VAFFHFVSYFVPLYSFGSSSICSFHVINFSLLLALFASPVKQATVSNGYTAGHAVAQLAEALRYKPEGRGFDSRWYNFHWHNPSGRTMVLGSTQPLTEMSTINISWG
jgi:hypothetical protein